MRVEVVKHNPAWRSLFDIEARHIQEVFGDNLNAVYHIGSTSVPGLFAKPIIDIMPVVRDIEKVDAYNPQMVSLGYEPMGEFGIPGRRYFRKGEDIRTHHVHVFQAGDVNVDRHLAFRDYLRAHPDEADIYGALKRELAAMFPTDMESYIQGKDALVKELEHKAVNWVASQKSM